MKNKSMVETLIKEKAKKFHVKIAEAVNMGNHIHIKLKTPSRVNFQKFLKSITCTIARKITGARRGKSFGQFWQGLAFTRVIKTSLEELQIRGYFEANREQRKLSYQQRGAFLQRFNQWIYNLRHRQSTV